MRIVLLGDSHLARVQRDLGRIGDPIVNAAAGGACVLDLLAQARSVPIAATDTVVVSVGTNDAAPWKAVPLVRFGTTLEDFLVQVRPARLVYLASPGVDEARVLGAADRTDQTMAAYRKSAADRFEAAGAHVIDSPALLAALGSRAFLDDGVHLTGAAYDVLLPAVAEACGSPI
ncbi:MAG: SGNH/GDSL hydrolase family protein [Nocardioides sp.]